MVVVKEERKFYKSGRNLKNFIPQFFIQNLNNLKLILEFIVDRLLEFRIQNYIINPDYNNESIIFEDMRNLYYRNLSSIYAKIFQIIIFITLLYFNASHFFIISFRSKMKMKVSLSRYSQSFRLAVLISQRLLVKSRFSRNQFS